MQSLIGKKLVTTDKRIIEITKVIDGVAYFLVYHQDNITDKKIGCCNVLKIINALNVIK
jgi:hypothetical protein